MKPLHKMGHYKYPNVPPFTSLDYLRYPSEGPYTNYLAGYLLDIWMEMNGERPVERGLWYHDSKDKYPDIPNTHDFYVIHVPEYETNIDPYNITAYQNWIRDRTAYERGPIRWNISEYHTIEPNRFSTPDTRTDIPLNTDGMCDFLGLHNFNWELNSENPPCAFCGQLMSEHEHIWSEEGYCRYCDIERP